ncbi:monooxygenase [Pullulanibacillus camelliae]|uniref:Monooxygenase n=1 Tax=Pullulanibacillus camelliae TaxID=1707096 RepID=A0A8J2VT23_9BACL|nr:NAD(P)/FAD-dependent oxidoreductase [Pullulanibacillus camelliae]GGE39948.1 monooxygenase [Pullulanibacillus camelliae]
MKKQYDVIIVGAGASGIGLGILLKAMHCEFCILEKERIGASFFNWPDDMRFITPSFPCQGFGQTDLNAVAPKTSPAYTLNVEHPSGVDYAEYLELLHRHFNLPVMTGIEVKTVNKLENGGFTIETSSGTLQSSFVIWAAGQFHYPNLQPFPGAELGIHSSLVDSWDAIQGDDLMIIGGFESGMNAAYQLCKRGKQVTVIAKTSTWEMEESDPSRSLSPYTFSLIENLPEPELLHLVGHAQVTGIKWSSEKYQIMTEGGAHFSTRYRPIIATGFTGSTQLIQHLFSYGEHGEPLVDAYDESIKTPGLFLAGPELRHDDHIFCFIYKFRQRYPIIAEAIGEALNLDMSIIEEYRKQNFYLDDLSSCGERCQC